MDEFLLSQINSAARKDPKSFIIDSERRYTENIDRAAELIAANMSRSRIVLLSGPSASGKTTSSRRIEAKLLEKGIKTHTISLDDYFKTIDADTPRDEKGEIDYESPFCMDIELLNEHFGMLSSGETVEIPRFDFKNQCRMDKRVSLKLGENDIAIFEGIHALNDMITQPVGDKALKLYIRVRSEVYNDNGDLFFQKNHVRLVRRLVRDRSFRGTSSAQTIMMWEGVRRGEHKYIVPYRESANIEIDTFLPYELCVLKKFVMPLLRELDDYSGRYEVINTVLHRLPYFESIPDELVPRDSILREFIGGSIFD